MGRAPARPIVDPVWQPVDDPHRPGFRPADPRRRDCVIAKARNRSHAPIHIQAFEITKPFYRL